MAQRPFELPPPGAGETRACWIWSDEGILYARFKLGAVVELVDAQDCIRRSLEEITNGKNMPAVVDLRWIRSQSAEARDYFASPEAQRLSVAVALLVESPLSRAIGNFNLGFNRPTYPTRLFTDEVAAKTWIRTFLPLAA